jgi:hypothetical protein
MVPLVEELLDAASPSMLEVLGTSSKHNLTHGDYWNKTKEGTKDLSKNVVLRWNAWKYKT